MSFVDDAVKQRVNDNSGKKWSNMPWTLCCIHNVTNYIRLDKILFMDSSIKEIIQILFYLILFQQKFD